MDLLNTPNFKLGIIAGGQLGKMLVLAASNLDITTYVLDSDPDCPASSCCSHFVRGSHLNFDDVVQFGQQVDLLTFEIESVNIQALEKLESLGVKISPSPRVLKIIQDKGLQKNFFKEHGIPTSPYTLFDNYQDISNALKTGTIQFPFVQKLRKGGYDGRGVAILEGPQDLENLLPGACVVEQKVPIYREISVIVARNLQGEIRSFPLVEMEFNPEANLVESLFCPSTLNSDLSEKAHLLAVKIISSLDLCGLLAVEMFVDTNQHIWVNEIAPRPHNSGHHTIESTFTSQYEQLLRAILNFPLGSTAIKLPSVMINLLGEPGYTGPVKYEGLSESLKLEGVKIHLYGKKQTKPFRKMGHVTVLSPSLEEAKKTANQVKNLLKVKSW